MKRFIFTILILVTFSFVISSCAFNKGFLNPTKVEHDVSEQTLHFSDDTVLVKYFGDNFQPLFIRNGRDTVTFNHTIESVMFPSTSKNMINGWFLKPKEVETKATILYFHGNSGDMALTHWNMTKLLQHGFQVFAIDYSGYGLSTGKAKRKSVLQDGISALEYVLQREEVKGKKLIIYGQSLGGNLAASVAGRKGELIDGLVVEGAFSSHKDIGRKFAGFLSDLLVNEMYSAKKSVLTYNKPILVIHSIEDNVVPYEHGETIYNAAQEPKELYLIDGCHICGSRLYHDEIAEKIFKMLQI